MEQGDPEECYKMGNRYLQERNFERAEKLLRKAVAGGTGKWWHKTAQKQLKSIYKLYRSTDGLFGVNEPDHTAKRKG